jgi:hypothetical protein
MAHAQSNLSFYWDRFSRRKHGEPLAFDGFQVQEAITAEGEILQAVVLGPHTSRGRTARSSKAIPVAAARNERPLYRGDKIVAAQVDESTEELRFVRLERDDLSIRTFRTGLISMGGGTQQDLADLRADGLKLRWHGSFALDVGSAKQIGEGVTVEVTAVAKMVADDQRGRVRGLVDVPEWRERGFEIPEGGAVINGDIGRQLTIHERKKGVMYIWDATDDPGMQALFERFIEEEIETRRKEREIFNAARAEKRLRLPDGHVDA